MTMATLIKWAMKLRWYDKTLVYIELGPSDSYFGWPLLQWSSHYVHIISFKLFGEHFTVFFRDDGSRGVLACASERALQHSAHIIEAIDYGDKETTR